MESFENKGFLDIEEGIQWIKKNSENLSSSKKTILARLQQFHKLCSEVGLNQHSISSLLDVILSKKTHFDKNHVQLLIKCLYPNELISQTIAIRIISSLDPHGLRCSYAIQAKLLNWLIHVYEFLDGNNLLCRYYGVLFHFLDFLTLRPYISNLLVLLTKHYHVKSFRIHQLLALYQKPGNTADPYLLALILTYKQHFPDVIVGSYTYRKHGSVRLDSEWIAATKAILNRQSEDVPLETWSSEKRKRQSSLIPDLITMKNTSSSYSLEELTSVQQMGLVYEKIVFPSRIAAVLKSKLFLIFLFLKNKNVYYSRLDEWLHITLNYGLALRSGSNNQEEEVLHLLYKYLLFSPKFPKSLLQYVITFFSKPNITEENYNLLTLLVTHIPITTDSSYFNSLLKEFEQFILQKNAEFCSKHLNILWLWLFRMLNLRIASMGNNHTLLEKCLLITNHATFLVSHFSWDVSLAYQLSRLFQLYYKILTKIRKQIEPNIPPKELIYVLFFQPSAFYINSMVGLLLLTKNYQERLMDSRIDAISKFTHSYLKSLSEIILLKEKRAILSFLQLWEPFKSDYSQFLPIATRIANDHPYAQRVFSLTCAPQFFSYINGYQIYLQQTNPATGSIPLKPIQEETFGAFQSNLHLSDSWEDFQKNFIIYLKKKGYLAISDFLLSTLNR
ncbi:CENP-I ortholog, inner centromere connector Mis6 [Schizosaccharomyces pombe]|uniref:Inner kinetochore subunit mis6 n=1 Tax=Schizosaccharomyces pombe (strain 972 / ATCC 24843) TaxID=284812 RepID=CENPI_SCHPO|nr:centromere connector protein mis6 [Schizosaccharomyces pombe]P87227.1 RecName: Full=Inner kinetochore subunit mis6; AltName: Full=CENP-I homolog; AltName: Full=Constitutive centromere-associated network protein mis6; AltName: Full=Sim4 complex subunit mis6 [Schizosaccharomyces pombe 972h-]BAA20458.1 Mis6 [Schizosaccharomyces pombe]CAA22614.1 inner centromere protein, CENP-I ortholog Mis6 [Schizosaccharomyces pombe]|eukprot:NP_593139.1 centromere connector protein mis6 [Schizosaccharomyces pombe]